jgi:putative endonuclease
MKRSTSEVGWLAESRALAYLQEKGLVLIDRNIRHRRGELDLVMRDGATLVFIEVRMRRSNRFGGAAASITATKRARLWRSAEIYLMRYAHPPACRFDAVCIDGNSLIWLKHILTG